VEGQVEDKRHLLLASGHQHPPFRQPEALGVLQDHLAGYEAECGAVVAHGNGAQVTVAGQDVLSGHCVSSATRRAIPSRVVCGKAGLPRKAMVPSAPDPSIAVLILSSPFALHAA